MDRIPQKDSIYASPKSAVGDFVFDEKVACVFEDMIQRSVPGYASIISMIGILAGQYAVPKSRCYDLGCSLGAATLAICAQVKSPGVEVTAVDNSQAMIDKCRDNIARQASSVPVILICDDIQNIKIENASMAVLNFTLQFIPREKREVLLKGIYNGMRPGGVLVISDKIAFENKEEEKIQTQWHHTFKKLNGYSDLEISQKRTALENVLIPDTLAVHKERLGSAGFENVFTWFQCFNFASIIAVK